MQGECNGKVGKRSFHNFDTAEPKLILYKDNKIFHMKDGLSRFFDVMIKKTGKVCMKLHKHTLLS